MPTMLSWINLADSAQEITASREVSGLGLRNLLTEPLAEVWRIPPLTLTAAVNLPWDSLAGAVAGANTTRIGTTTDPDGGTAAVIYSSLSISTSFVRATTTYPVVAGATYRVEIWARRITGAGTTGSLVRVQLSSGTVFGLPVSAVTASWQRHVLDFTPATSGTATIWWYQGAAATTGQIAFYGGQVLEQNRYTDLDVVLPAAQPIGVVALFAPRDSYLPPNYQAALMASTTAIGEAEALNLPATPMALADNRGAWWCWPASAFTARYIRLRLLTTGGDSYAQFGRLWIGPDFRPAIQASRTNHRRGVMTAGVVERAAVSGIVTAQRGATYRASRFTLPLLTHAEAVEVETAALTVGTHGQIVANPRTQDGAASLLLGRFEAPPEPELVAPRRWSASLAVLEDL